MNSESQQAVPIFVHDEGMRKLISYRFGACAGCEWHPNVCDYCVRSHAPDFDVPPIKENQ